MLKKSTILFWALVVVYVAVRLWRLDDSCLWFDEVFSVHAAEHPWNSLFWFVAQDLIHPPLFYVLLKTWISIGGESLLWLRLFPVAFSTLAVVPFVYLCRELKLTNTATLLALTFFAVNGSLIKYAQEVRMYAPLLFFSLCSTWLFARFYFRGKNIWILTLVNVLLIYTHYFGWFVLAAEVAAIFVFQRVKIRHVLIMSGIAFVAFVPWIAAVARAANAGSDVTQNIGWMTRPGPSRVLEFVFDLIEPFYYQQSSAEASTLLYISIPLLLTIAAAKAIMLIDWKRNEEKTVFYLTGLFAATPIVLAFAVSWFAPVSIWGSRHLIIVFPPMAILAGMFLTSVAIRPVRYGMVAVSMLLVAAAFVVRIRSPQQEYVWCSWEKLATEWILAPHFSLAPKKLYAYEDLIAYHMWFATRELQNYKVSVITNADGIPDDPAYFVPRGFDRIGQGKLDEITDEIIWIAFRGRPRPECSLISFIGCSRELAVSGLEERGYDIDDVRKIEAGSETAYLIKLVRRPEPGSD